MPTYEYECQKCGHRFDEFQSMTAKPLVRCPKCKGKLKRLIGAGAGILLKGSGFYGTDYRSSSYKEKQKSDASAGSSSASNSSSSSEASGGAKPDAAAPATKPAEKASEKATEKSGAKPKDASGKKAKRD